MSSQTKVELLKSSREILKAKRYSISDSPCSISVVLRGYKEGEPDVKVTLSTLPHSIFEDLENEDGDDENE